MAFSNSILKYVPPKKGRSNVLRILSDLIVLKQEADLFPPRKTNINSCKQAGMSSADEHQQVQKTKYQQLQAGISSAYKLNHGESAH